MGKLIKNKYDKFEKNDLTEKLEFSEKNYWDIGIKEQIKLNFELVNYLEEHNGEIKF